MVVAKINRNSCLNFWKLILRTFILLACCDWQLSRNTTIHFIKFWIHNIHLCILLCLPHRPNWLRGFLIHYRNLEGVRSRILNEKTHLQNNIMYVAFGEKEFFILKFCRTTWWDHHTMAPHDGTNWESVLMRKSNGECFHNLAVKWSPTLCSKTGFSPPMAISVACDTPHSSALTKGLKFRSCSLRVPLRPSPLPIANKLKQEST